jgi:hypothetical protein
MRKLPSIMVFLLLSVALVVWAVGDTIMTGTVWFVPDEEEAPCVDVSVYTLAGCNPVYLLGTVTTDSCGQYSIGGIAAPCTVWVVVEFDANRICASGSWSGTCPSTTIPCEPVWVADQPSVPKDWDLELDDCDNVGCY